MPQFQSICRTGIRHMENALPCSDAAAESLLLGCRACALCDGAGDPAGGRIAAKLVSETVSRQLALHFPRYLYEEEETVRREVSLTVHQALQAKALGLGMPLKTLACTILAAAANDQGQWVALHLGDGGIWGRFGKEGGWQAVSGPQRGPRESGTCLTMSCNLPLHLRLYRSLREEHTELLLLTDGAQELFLRRGKPGMDALRKLFRSRTPCSGDDYSFAWLSSHGSSPPPGKPPVKGERL